MMRIPSTQLRWAQPIVLVALGLVWSLWSVPALAQTGNSCIDCHAAQVPDRLRDPATNIVEDVHYTKGFACQDCHGGDPSRGLEENNPRLAHDRSMGFVGAPKPEEIPDFCARCHSDVEFMKAYNPKMRVDQLLEYSSSRHGKGLAGGDARVATCTSCHGVHGILPVSDTRSPVYKVNVATTCAKCHANEQYMSSYDIPTDQMELYVASVHGQKLLGEGDLAAPTCNNCHGNHGATPPGISTTSEVCGECHANNREFFNQSRHKTAFAESDLGECVTCHNHHEIAKPNDAMVGTGDDAICMDCHDEGDLGYAGAEAMSAGLDTLKMALASAHELLDKAERGGVDVDAGKYDLHAADDALIKARTAIHFFDPEKFNEVFTIGRTEAANVIALGEEALWNLKLRGIGLAFAIPLILWVALGLVMKIRQIERAKPLP